jgi:hypothetical protein
MEKLIETIVSVLEIMVLGLIAVGVLGYLLALFNPARKVLADYLNELSRIVVDGAFHSYSEWIKIGLSLGFIYYMGILANGAAYWVLSPVHNRIISDISAKGKAMPRFRDLCLLPLSAHSEDEHIDAYLTYLGKEVSWQNHDLEAAKHALDAMHRDIRIYRGTVFLALCLVLIALLKLACALVFLAGNILPMCVNFWQWYRKGLTSLYGLIIDDDLHFLNQARKDAAASAKPTVAAQPLDPSGAALKPEDFRHMGRIGLKKICLPNLIICSIAFTVYFLAMCSWKSVETEYHLIVQEGEKTARKEKPLTAPVANPNNLAVC